MRRVNLALATVIGLGAVLAAKAQPARPALVETATLPPMDIARFGRPPLTPRAVASAMKRGMKFRDRPSIGSGLTWLGGDDFVGVTDRGPNDDEPKVVGHADGVLFPLPRFTPSLVRFRWRSGRIIVSAIMPIHGADGHAVTGLPDTDANAAGYDRPSARTALSPDPRGLDIEGVRRLPDGKFLLVDEYGPSLIVTTPTGEILKRYLPPSRVKGPAPFPVDGQVPDVFTRRRANRGFESLALSSDGRRAWTIMEGPLGPRNDLQYKLSRMVRVLEWDVADPLAARPVAQFLLPLSRPPAGMDQDDVRISEAAWLSDTRLLIVEPAPGRLRLVIVDFARATNILGRAEADTLTIDASGASLSTWGITPAATTVVFDNGDLPLIREDKLEGLAIVSDREVVLASDNDFGMGDNRTGARAQLWRLRWPEALTIPR